MSWLNNLTDLAGKAETLLNNIDQTAAVAISKAKDDQHEIDSTNLSPKVQARPVVTPQTHKQEQTLARTPLDAMKMREFERSKPAVTSDDALFDFLNSDKKVKRTRSATTVPHIKKTTQVVANNPVPRMSPAKPKADVKEDLSSIPTSLEISRSSSFDSNHSKLSGRFQVDNGSSSSEPHEADVITLPTDSTASESEFEMVGSTAAASLASDRDSPSSTEMVLPSVSSSSDLVVENRLLRNEITTLHQEMQQTTQRYRKIKTDIQSSNNELRSKLDDLTEELKVKSSQLSAIQMKLRESENLLLLEQENSGKLQCVMESLKQDQSDGSSMHLRALEEIRSRLEEAEYELAREKKAHSETRQGITNHKQQQEHETKKLVESYQKAERGRQVDKKNLDDLKAENRSLKSSLSQSKQELSDYKQKASRILQSKERLITSLKGSEELDMTSSTMASLEIEDVRQERDAALEHVASLQLELQNLRAEFQETEQQYQQENSDLAQELNDFRRQAQEETRARQELQAELSRIQEDMRRDREEAARLRSASQARLKDKDTEVDRLRNQLMIKSQSSPQEGELESRLRQLTETVIQKQAIIETLSTEKNSLHVQMERMESQVKRLSQEAGSHVHVNVDGDDRRHPNGSSHVSEFTYGGSEYGVVGKVKKAATVLDRFSIRLGVFLKRYPPARLFLLFYMILLHVWVMIVLLTYTPEVHGQDFVGPRRTDLMVGC